MNLKSKRVTSLLIASTMVLTSGASALAYTTSDTPSMNEVEINNINSEISTLSYNKPYAPLDQSPINRVEADGTKYSRWYAGEEYYELHIKGAAIASNIALAIAAGLGVPMSSQMLGWSSALIQTAQLTGTVYFSQYKYIETRQKPGDTSPVFTTLYYVTGYDQNGKRVGPTNELLSYVGMSPYSIGDIK